MSVDFCQCFLESQTQSNWHIVINAASQDDKLHQSRYGWLVDWSLMALSAQKGSADIKVC